MHIIVQYAFEHKRCRVVSLRNNNITALGASVIADGLDGDRALMSLTLDGNRILDAGVEHLAKAFTQFQGRLFVLSLDATGMTDAACEHLADMVALKFSMSRLSLRNNEISDRGVQVLCERIVRSGCGVGGLDLSGNKLLTDGCVDALCTAIGGNGYWHNLHLHDCQLSATGRERVQTVAARRQAFTVHW